MRETTERQLEASGPSLAALRSTNCNLTLTKTLTSQSTARFFAFVSGDTPITRPELSSGLGHLYPHQTHSQPWLLATAFPRDWTLTSDSGWVYSKLNVLLWLPPKASPELKTWVTVAYLADNSRKYSKGGGGGKGRRQEGKKP